MVIAGNLRRRGIVRILFEKKEDLIAHQVAQKVRTGEVPDRFPTPPPLYYNYAMKHVLTKCCPYIRSSFAETKSVNNISEMGTEIREARFQAGIK